jgi:hypothetical protein
MLSIVPPGPGGLNVRTPINLDDLLGTMDVVDLIC